MVKSITVTNAAITKIKTGTRISDGTKRRTGETAPFEAAITSAVAKPKLKPFTADVVTAKVGHKPSNCTTPGFCFQSPLWAISLN